MWRDADGTLWRHGSVLTVVLWGVLIVARGLLYGVGVAVGHRDASDLGAVLVTLALSFAAQNTVTAMRMNAAPPLPAGQPAGSQPAEPSASRSTVIPSRLAAHDRLHTRRPGGTGDGAEPMTQWCVLPLLSCVGGSYRESAEPRPLRIE